MEIAAKANVKYVRKKINAGTLAEWKKQQFLEIAAMRDMEEHTGEGGKVVDAHKTRVFPEIYLVIVKYYT